MFDVAVTAWRDLAGLCATLISTIVLPAVGGSDDTQPVEAVVQRRREWVLCGASRGAGVYDQAKRLRLATGATSLDALITSLQYESSGSEQSAAAVATLRQHMLMFLPVIPQSMIG